MTQIVAAHAVKRVRNALETTVAIQPKSSAKEGEQHETRD